MVPRCDTIPLIDLGGDLVTNCDRVKVIHQIVKASQEHGFFQVLIFPPFLFSLLHLNYMFRTLHAPRLQEQFLNVSP